MSAPSMTTRALNENTILLSFDLSKTGPTPESCQYIAQLSSAVLDHPHIVDCTPAYDSILVTYNFLKMSTLSLTEKIKTTRDNLKLSTNNTSEPLTIPVYYADDSGPDLHRVATLNNISKDEVVRQHTNTTYFVYAVGFLPGFAYLGFVENTLATPRLDTPRRHVPAGAVGIADKQTGMYPSDSPGGWNIIGQCPFDFWKKERGGKSFYVGQKVRFEDISRTRFLALGGELTWT